MEARDAMVRSCRAALLVGALLLPGPSARACPVCDRETGRQVRAGLRDRDLGLNLLATLLPFGVFLGIAAAIHGAPPRREGTPGPREDGHGR